MLDNLLLGFDALMTPMALFAVTIGVIGGVVIGSLPGLTSTMGVALLIPLTFSMPPEAGLAMLGGIYLASTYSGSISAIILNIPGTPAAVATLLDGHPMSKRGETTRALALATFGSSIGGLLSVIALLLLAPPLAEFSLKFGSPEYFLLAVFGITVIASLSAGAMSKGLIAGAMGLLLSTIGSHPLTGELRFTFGQPSLYDGIPMVVSLIGLYSIPEVISMMSGKTTLVAQTGISGDRGPFSYLGEVLRRKFNILRSSLIGIIVGIIPGVGCSVGGFLSYDAAKRAAHNKEEFGNGAPDGVIASETANNAVTGGTLIPLLTLGIPGNPVTAVLLGGLMIHGLRPGADLFTLNAGITYGFMLSLLLANILFVPVGLIFARYCAKVITVPREILAPCILAFAVIGSYSIRGSVEDILIMLAVGIIGFGFNFFAVPRAPLVLGLVLGTLAEGELARSLALVSGNVPAFLMQLVTRPICIVLLILCAFALYQGVVQHRRNSHMLDS
ncbi:tripartite tricarboxylate transporter permease [Cohaesibacter gelatinilyticus]|uniref:Putative tricarboxylic transport membrane protein n=1 Tax=Cohaesibacter gelatinilyticus TaxID=372072 RepID=A0A285PHF1_9HYPH|nr:tripartite tricarboxylate transporter permease [Cohaesibacter gelatinilyticus]SNZ21144.1 putative tricarboxylic transport membrane protein [Cohaesibacter gelatinilyticus]